MIKAVRKGFVGVFCLLFVSGAIAAPSPLPMMKSVANQTLTALKRNQNRLKGNPAVIRRIVNRVVMPHIGINGMAGRVVGRSYWLQATPAQRSVFAQLFKVKVISTYSNALASYNDDRVLFYPLRGKIGNYAKVRSIIVRRNGQRIPLDYTLRYQGGWKIIDFSVENVSIVNNFRAQYAGALNEGGLKNLIARMRR